MRRESSHESDASKNARFGLRMAKKQSENQTRYVNGSIVLTGLYYAM